MSEKMQGIDKSLAEAVQGLVQLTAATQCHMERIERVRALVMAYSNCILSLYPSLSSITPTIGPFDLQNEDCLNYRVNSPDSALAIYATICDGFFSLAVANVEIDPRESFFYCGGGPARLTRDYDEAYLLQLIPLITDSITWLIEQLGISEIQMTEQWERLKEIVVPITP